MEKDKNNGQSIMTYFNLPFDCYVVPEDVLYRFNYYRFNQFEKTYLGKISNMSKLASLTYNNLGLYADENSHYNEVEIYDLSITDNQFLSQTIELLCKVIKKVVIFIIHKEQEVFLACGNVNFLRKDNMFKYLSASINLGNLTYNAQNCLKFLNFSEMTNLNTIHDYIFKVVSGISWCPLRFIRYSKAVRLTNFVFSDGRIETKDVMKGLYIKKVGKSVFVEEEELWRKILSVANDKELRNYKCINDICVDMKREKERYFLVEDLDDDDEDKTDYDGYLFKHDVEEDLDDGFDDDKDLDDDEINNDDL